jgi:peptidoglycan/LPS O-acetylase OafA/YrhL
VHHFFTVAPAHKLFNSSPQFFKNVVGNSFGAVSIFFILSGFVIMFSTLQSGRKFKVVNFYRNRLVRIYPLYLVGLLSSIALLRPSIAPSNFLRHLFMFQTLIPQSGYDFYDYNLPAWSICAEIVFYVSFPLLVPLIRLRKFKYLGILFLIIALYGSWIYAKACEMALSQEESNITALNSLANILANYAQQHSLSFDYVIYANPYSRVFDFLAGVSIAICFYYFPKHFKNIGVKLFSIILVLGVLRIVVFESNLARSSFGRDFIFLLLGVFLIIAILAMSSVANKERDSEGKGFRLRKFLLLLGDSSYALYILQWPLVHFVARWTDHVNVALGWLIFLFSTLTMVAISIGAHRLVEVPLLKRFKRL